MTLNDFVNFAVDAGIVSETDAVETNTSSASAYNPYACPICGSDESHIHRFDDRPDWYHTSSTVPDDPQCGCYNCQTPDLRAVEYAEAYGDGFDFDGPAHVAPERGTFEVPPMPSDLPICPNHDCDRTSEWRLIWLDWLSDSVLEAPYWVAPICDRPECVPF